MLWSTRYVSCISALWAFPILSKPTAGTGFVPREVVAGEAIARRACAPAAPDVSKSSIISDVCNQTLANDFGLCSEQLTVSIQKSAANTCAQYSGLFTDCLMANQNDSTACSDALLGYQDCEVYTLQAYAYCGCYYTLPTSIADCANQQLQSQPQDAAMVPPTTNTSSTAIPSSPKSIDGAVVADQQPTPATSEEPTTPVPSPSPLTSSDPRILASAVTADQEPTPSDSDEPTSPASSPSPLTSSDPRTPSAPPQTLDTFWSPNATPSASSELSTTTTTVVLTYTHTYTSTFTPAASYYTNTITSTATSTIYNTCANIGIDGVESSAATPAITPTTTTAVIVSAGQNPTAETIITIPGGDASSSSSSSSFEEGEQTAGSPQEETPTSTSTFTYTSTFSSPTSPSPPPPPPPPPPPSTTSPSSPLSSPLASNTAILPPPPPPSPLSTTMMTAPMRNASSVSVSAVSCQGCSGGRRARRRSRILL